MPISLYWVPLSHGWGHTACKSIVMLSKIMITRWWWLLHTWYLSFFYTGKIFGQENLHRNLHSKLPIFRVESVKIYTGHKNLHWRCQPRQRQLSGMVPDCVTDFLLTKYFWWMRPNSCEYLHSKCLIMWHKCTRHLLYVKACSWSHGYGISNIFTTSRHPVSGEEEVIVEIIS